MTRLTIGDRPLGGTYPRREIHFASLTITRLWLLRIRRLFTALVRYLV